MRRRFVQTAYTSRVSSLAHWFRVEIVAGTPWLVEHAKPRCLIQDCAKIERLIVRKEHAYIHATLPAVSVSAPTLHPTLPPNLAATASPG